MKIIFLGTGNAWGLPNEIIQNTTDVKDYRKRTSLYIESGKNILIDCGPDFKEQRIKYEIKNIDALLLTHTHQDHTGGLDELNIYRRAYKNWKLPTYAHTDAIKYLKEKKDLNYLFDSILIEKIVTPDESFPLDNLLVTPFKTNHGSFAPGSVGYIIDEKDKRIVYTSDFSSIVNDAKIKEKNIDKLVIETNWFSEPLTNKPGHMSFQNALKYIEDWKPKEVYLTHFGDEIIQNEKILPYKNPTNHKEWDEAVRQEFTKRGLTQYLKQENIITFDGLKIEL
ncbi:Ribonuclease BN [Candidatus Tiddalikarchaeum anstoanum]|nr:Ribonuclease BN [Candidatus Tiddalikarchaeum anstoanum]